MSGDIFGCHCYEEGASDTETRDAAKHLRMRRATKNYLAPNVHGIEGEKP